MNQHSDAARATDQADDLRRSFSAALVVFIWAHLPVAVLVGLFGDLPVMGPAIAIAVLGGVTTLLWMQDPVSLEMRLVSAVALAGLPAVLVYQLAGHPWQLDMHMYFFALLAVLSAWCDWRPILLAAGVIALHHLTLNFLMPNMVYPAGGASFGRVLVHAVVVVIETGVLVWIAEALRKGFARAAAATEEAQVALGKVEAAGAGAEAERRMQSERRETLARTASAFEEQAGQALAAVNKAAGDLVKVVGALRDASAETGTEAKKVLTTSQSSARAVGGVASSAGEMTSAIGSAASQVERAAEIARLSLARSEESASVINALAGDAQEIGQVIGLIRDVAAQTNLLALNATIEAARAGEAGRGFAVVAQEVKALAEQTARATDQIKGRVESVQTRVGEAVQAIAAIQAVVHDLNAVAGRLNESMDEQRSTVGEIAGASTHVAQDAKAVLTGVEAVVRATDDVVGLAARLADVVGAVKGEMSRLETHIHRFAQDARAA